MSKIKDIVAPGHLADGEVYFKHFGSNVTVRIDRGDDTVRIETAAWFNAADLRKLSKLAKRLAEALDPAEPVES